MIKDFRRQRLCRALHETAAQLGQFTANRGLGLIPQDRRVRPIRGARERQPRAPHNTCDGARLCDQKTAMADG